MHFSLLPLVLLTTQLLKVGAQPILALPFNEQLPDVARVGEPYSFQLSSETFRSSSGSESVSYAISNAPSWLNLDSGSRTLSGTPDSDSNVTFTLTGTDSTGSIDQQCALVVSSNASPVLKSENYLYQQLAKSEKTNGYDGVVVKPNEKFNIKFDKDTFTIPSNSSNGIVAYYGKSSNGTSLPIWCHFDEDSLTFSGTAPTVNAMNAPSQEFDMVLIATDFAGYSAAFGNFRLVVGGHYLISEEDSPILINGTVGKNISEKVPLSSIYLDGEQISTQNVSSVQIYQGPDWVSLSGNNTLIGTVPNNTDSDNALNVTVTDIYGDSVYVTFEIDVSDRVFTIKSFPNVNATRDHYFNYTISNSSLQDPGYTKISASISDADWLKFDSSNNTFNGWVPKSFESAVVDLQGTMDSLKETRKITFKGVDGSVTSSSSFTTSSTATTSTGTSSATSSSPSATAASSAEHKSSLDTNKKLAIGLGVSLPVAFLILLGLLFGCCWKRRKHDDDNDDEKQVGTVAGGPVGPMRKSPTNDTLSPDGKKNANEKNAEELENRSLSTASSATNVDRRSSLRDSHSGRLSNSSRIKNSWRRHSGKSGWKPRDSLSSLATVTTNDLLTMSVVDDPNLQRRSQMNLLLRPNNTPGLGVNGLSNTNLITSYRNSRVKSIARASSTSQSVTNTEPKDDIDNASTPSSNIDLLESEPSSSFKDAEADVTPKVPIGRDESAGSSGSAELVDFEENASAEKKSVGNVGVDNRSSKGIIEEHLGVTP